MVRLTLSSAFITLGAIALFSITKQSALAETSPEKFFEAKKNISQAISSEIRKNRFPASAFIELDNHKDTYEVKYTIDKALQRRAEMMLRRYKPDYGAIVMINAETGKILAMASQQKGHPNAENLNLRASFPAASVFKVVTATAAVDHAKVDPKHRIAFNGANYTLHKSNVLSDKINKWTRFITLKDAFARSINTAFGRLTLENLSPEIISDYADKFMFNNKIMTDFSIERSVANVPSKKGFELTQVAAGYNNRNTLSPVHGAMIAAAIINEGRMVTPYIVDRVLNDADEVVYKGQSVFNAPVMTKASAAKIKDMMEQTVLTGTSRKTFRQMVRTKKFKAIEMGGKTGHFTGRNPKGKTDWFVGYATDGNSKIAVAAITVNVKKWTVKSSALAQMMFEKYYE